MSNAQTHEPLDHEVHRRALDAIYKALDEIDDGPLSEPRLRTPETVLIGEDGLESLAFVTFAVTLEEHLQGSGWTVSVFDVLPQDVQTCTAGQLAAHIGAVVESRAR